MECFYTKYGGAQVEPVLLSSLSLSNCIGLKLLSMQAHSQDYGNERYHAIVHTLVSHGQREFWF